MKTGNLKDLITKANILIEALPYIQEFSGKTFGQWGLSPLTLNGIFKSDWGEGFGGIWMGFNVPWGKF